MPILKDGQKILETYEVERFLGEGAFAEVYRVKHRILNRLAMKVFKTVGMSLKEIEEMMSEAILLSKMEHRNIIRVFDANIAETKDGVIGFFTMEYVAGGSLDNFWYSFGDKFIPIETTMEIMRQVCRGLNVAHSENPPIVHRDIKPQNILIGYDDSGLRARVSDFGLAKRVNPLTLLASAAGTKIFKAPEVIRNQKSDSCAGDVWALGCILYMLLTDRFPFKESEEMELIDISTFEEPVIVPSRLNTCVNPSLDKIVLKALDLNHNKRYQNAKSLLMDLDKWKPSSKRDTSKSELSSGLNTTKTAFGDYTSANEEEAEKMSRKAIELSKYPNKLKDAADIMEEAFNKWPKLREKNEYQLKLWRRGISG